MERLGQVALFGLVAGLLVGLAPLVYGAVKGRIALGFAGLLVSGAAGLALGLILAIPVAALFAYLIYRSTRPRTTETGAGRTEP